MGPGSCREELVAFVYPYPTRERRRVGDGHAYDWDCYERDRRAAWEAAVGAVQHLRAYGHPREPYAAWLTRRIAALAVTPGAEAWLRNQLDELGKGGAA